MEIGAKWPRNKKKSENTLKSQQDVVKIFCFFSLSGLFIGVLRVPGENIGRTKLLRLTPLWGRCE